MPKLSANLGFLWTELSLPAAIARAKEVGFGAVECHFPYEFAAEDVKSALDAASFKMVGLNTRLGINGADDFGVTAKPGREAEARQYIDEAIAYGAIIGALNINSVAGKTDWSDQAEATYRENLAYACDKAADHGMGVVIEPINQRDAPGYHLRTLEQGIETIKAVGKDNLKLMLDCYHTQIMQGDVTLRIKDCLPYVGHIQIAAVPDRGEPDAGEINYPWLLAAIDDMGWNGFIGAEYKPRTTTDEGIAWLEAYR